MESAFAALALMIGLSTGAHAQDEVREIRCAAVDADGGRTISIGRYSVLRETHRDGPLGVNFSGDIDIIGFTCRRTSPVPQPNDYKVAMAGLALFVEARRGGQSVRTALLIEDGQFKLQILEGRLTAAERSLAVERIEGYYEAINTQTAEITSETG